MNTPELTLKTRIARLAPYFANSRRGFILMIIGSLVGAATEPLVPALMKPLFDNGFSGATFPLWMVPVAIIGTFALRGVAGLVAQYGLSWAANRGTQEMREVMFRRMLKAEPSLFGKNTASSLTNMLTYEVQTGSTLLVGSLMTLVRDSFTVLALFAYLIYVNWALTLFVAVLFPLTAVVMRKLSKRLHRLTIEGRKATDQLAYVVEENVLAWRIVRLHGAENVQASRFDGVSDVLRRLSLKSAMAGATMTPITQMIAACSLSAVVVAALWQGGSQGTFVSFITCMLMLLAPIKHLSDVAAPITRGLASLERGVALINEVPMEHGGTHDPGRALGKVELRDVTLQYKTDQQPALAGLTFTIEAGETVALVGPSGAGKSTLVNLLPRFLEPTSGTVLLDDQPLQEWRVDALRRQFALVSQDVVLFNDTMAANVALGTATNVPVDRAAVKEALRAANLLDFAEGLPQGLDTLVGHNGSQLSGGQRQRLAIARAIYKNAPILILDEATSALDSESERLVQEALEALMKGRTSIVIAHRLSTIKSADRVLVLEEGRVIEQGTHAELLAQGGLFAHLHSLQFRH
ncbi:lipid A export permease/ATP-binding protein MsbA [Rhizobacter sp. Root1221]|uniref:lipid A export permease/ATP-binding protein MsbA n=1 Tax=Rhizobacter sp. Root1221 TaxID=1736433 RepID=UPI0006F5452E|nr:lipid A export permease/ATP-binding protein MsbA [Rhizobacter sp. Root1221]KQW02242.1 lipid A export permease/ATP-binding protein MsbA [Rhizobacter sp. Root1221]